MIDRTKRIWIGASVAVIALVIVLVLVLGQKDQAAEDGSLEGKGPVVELVFQMVSSRHCRQRLQSTSGGFRTSCFRRLRAAWCGPCRTAAPFIDTLPQTFAGQARVVKVDVDNARSLPGITVFSRSRSSCFSTRAMSRITLSDMVMAAKVF
jgi:thioredoxin 1